MIIAKVI